MYNKCNNEHYDLVASFSKTDGFKCSFFLTALLKNGIVCQIKLEKIIILYNYS